MNQHTPGPWKVTTRCPAPFVDVDATSGRTLAVVQSGPKEDLPAEANACLMAAAPDLLEGAKQITSWLRYFKQHYPYMVELIIGLEKLMVAIAKAEGKTP